MIEANKQLFWDVDLNEMDMKRYPSFIIKRILEYGDKAAVKWMFDHFKLNQIKRTLLKKRGISPRSANYWALVLGVSKDKIPCLKKQSQKKLQKTWLY